MNRRCIDCGKVTRELTRCASCQSKRRRRYGSTWTRTSKAIRSVVRSCEWCQATEDLCVDHVVPGRLDGGLRVLCRSCNSRRVHGYSGPSGGVVGPVGGLPSRTPKGVDAFSVGFRPIRDRWNQNRDIVERVEVALAECSLVGFGAYSGAVVHGVRTEQPTHSLAASTARARLSLHRRTFR